MDAAALKEMQAPFKERYRDEPEAAVITLKAEGAIGEGVTCSVQTAQGAGRGGAASGDRRQRRAAPARATCCSRRSSPAPA